MQANDRAPAAMIGLGEAGRAIASGWGRSGTATSGGDVVAVTDAILAARNTV